MDTSFQKTTASDEWYTPLELVSALGEFDLDPCEPMDPLWHLAKRGFNKEDDGLKQDWGGGTSLAQSALQSASIN